MTSSASRDVNPREAEAMAKKAQRDPNKRSGSKKKREGPKGAVPLDPDRIQRTRDRYRDEMVVDAPASGTREDQE